MGPIPWDKIVQYGLVEELDHDMIRALVRIIRAMDTAYLEWMGEQADRQTTPAVGTSGRTVGKVAKTPKNA